MKVKQISGLKVSPGCRRFLKKVSVKASRQAFKRLGDEAPVRLTRGWP